MSIRINNLQKSKSDKLDYCLKILKNNLKVLIVSDNQTNFCSACLQVNSGNLNDFPEYPGIAHFCEHMLFMGTEKYPKTNYYADFIQKNSGNSNASTGLETTTFYFQINKNKFREALEIFSEFFKKPLFSQDCIEKELNAVDSENKKNYFLDSWRFFQLRKSESNSNSAFTKFTTGNLKTLNKPNIRDILLDYYNKFYTSEIMNLCIYTNETINEIEEFIDKLFEEIPKKENYIKPEYNKVLPYDKNNLQYLYKIIPVKDKDQIDIIWYLPICKKEYKKKPLNFISSVLGHEGPFSLASSLKKDSLINSLVSSFDHVADTYSKFKLSMNLTKKGLSNINDILLRIFHFIYILQNKEINKEYFNDYKNIYQFKFDYKNKLEPINFVKTYINNLRNYENEDVLTGSYLIKEFDEELIKKYLNLLNIENCNIYIFSKIYENECNLIEKWYETKYNKEKFTFSLNDIINYKCNHKLDYPPKNLFIPNNFDILPIMNENMTVYPEKILNDYDKDYEVWYKQDNIFKLPKAIINCYIILENEICNNSKEKNFLLAKILNSITKFALNENFYMALEANVSFKYEINYDKIILQLSGFNNSLNNAFKIFLNEIKNIDYSKYEEKFNHKIEKMKQKFNNFFLDKSYSVAILYLHNLMIYKKPIPSYLLKILNNNEITFNDFIKFSKNIYNNLKYKWLIQGNLTKEEAINFIEYFNQKFNINPIVKNNFQISLKNSINIKKNTNFIFIFFSPNLEEKNSSIISFYQCEILSKKDLRYLNLISLILKEKFYNSLRTNQNLGYVVSMSIKEYRQNYGLCCVVQSNVKCPEFISEKINEFFKEQLKFFENLTDDEFKNYVNSLIETCKKKDANLSVEFKRNLSQIYLNNYEFNQKEIIVKILENDVNKLELLNFYKKNILNEIHKIDVEFICESHKKENEEYLNKLNEEKNNLNYSRILCKNIVDFQGFNELFPDYNQFPKKYI